ncbi:MAG: hypothetical protein H6865_01685 [Rhodospirillales bacterium]|nr:hypothetical protein [Alphaproteobacteria bacterium]MCB9986330.1 hypothetical protein [Rhodospirillales bacterium]USO07120.1 MAG: hypothetical protein H6866_06700 [Rhodospirillales bacterium]
MPPLLYRVFLLPLTVFFAAFLALGTPHAAHAGADDPYSVKGISVDVTGTSALDARNKAFSEARRKAWQAMAEKIVPQSRSADIVVPDDRVIAGVVRDVEIVNEKMTSRRYAGTLDIRFDPSAAKRTIQLAAAEPAQQPQAQESPAAATVTHTDASGVQASVTTVSLPRQQSVQSAPQRVSRARPVLVLPWYGAPGGQTLWGQANPWRAAWEERGALARDKSVPVVLPVGDVEDVRDYSPPQPISLRGNLNALLRRYETAWAVAAVAEPQRDGGVSVALYKTDGDDTIPVGRFTVPGTARDPLGTAVDRAMTLLRAAPGAAGAVTRNTLDDAAPPRMPVDASAARTGANTGTGMDTPMGAYRTLARFSNLREWVTIRQALARVPGLESVNVQSISPGQASLQFAYNGGPQMLAGAMAQAGLNLTQLPPGAVASPALGGASPQFLLAIGNRY